MAHTIDELKKTEIEDPEIAKTELHKLDHVIENYKKEIEEKESQKSVLEYQIRELEIDNKSKRELEKLGKQLEKLKSSLKEATDANYSSEDVHKMISDIENEISSMNHERGLLSQDITHTLMNIDHLSTSMHSIKIAIEKEKQSLNIESIEEYLVNLKKKANIEYQSAFDDLPITCTKEEFDEFYVCLKNQQRTLNITYEYGKGPIREVLKGMKKKEDIPSLIASSLLALESRQNAERLSIIDRLISHYAGIKISCEKECPLKFLQQELLELKDAKPIEEVKYTAEFYQMMKLSYDNISMVFHALSEQKEVIQKLPVDIQAMFTIDRLCDKIGNAEMIYDEKILNDLLSFLTERENYRKLEEEIAKVGIELEEKKKISRVGFLTEELDNEERKINSLKETLSIQQEQYSSLEEGISNRNEQKDEYLSMEEALSSYEDKRDAYEVLNQKIKKEKSLSLELTVLETELSSLYLMEKEFTENRYRLEANIQNYEHLSENLQVQKLTYEDYNNLKFACSNKTGIPLFYIKKYLKRTVSIANEIIDIAYHGDLMLDEFDIDEDKFDIPYIKNGIRIDDVSSASQGEESFFNLAISSALRSQSITRFNIGLFDEIDSEFDDNNRQHFIPVLEKTMELNGINQAFLITHNLMFRQYPVDIINLGDLHASTIAITYE